MYFLCVFEQSYLEQSYLIFIPSGYRSSKCFANVTYSDVKFQYLYVISRSSVKKRKAIQLMSSNC